MIQYQQVMKHLNEHMDYCCRFMDYITNGDENDFRHATETLINLMTNKRHWRDVFYAYVDDLVKATIRHQEEE